MSGRNSEQEHPFSLYSFIYLTKNNEPLFLVRIHSGIMNYYIRVII